MQMGTLSLLGYKLIPRGVHRRIDTTGLRFININARNAIRITTMLKGLTPLHACCIYLNTWWHMRDKRHKLELCRTAALNLKKLTSEVGIAVSLKTYCFA